MVKQYYGWSLVKEVKMRKFQFHSHESEMIHKDFLSTKAFLARAYLKDISKKFSKENFKIILENKKKNYVYMEMLLKIKERLFKHKKMSTLRYHINV